MKNSIIVASALISIATFAAGCADTPSVQDTVPQAIGIAAQRTEIGEHAKAPAAHAKSAKPSQNLLFPRQARPFGTSYEDWTAAWWQWSLALPKDVNPMQGGACDQNQSGQVFFLAGTTGGADTRDCTIPVGKGIFFPLVNVVMFSCPEYAGGPGYTCEDAMSDDFKRDCLDSFMTTGEHTLILEIDGVAVSNLEAYRAQSDSFIETSPADPAQQVFPGCTGPIRENSCGVEVGSSRNALTDGYWAMLRPLPAGQHEIRFAANMDYGDWGFSLDVTYNITVAP